MSSKPTVLVFHRNCLFRDCLASFLSSSLEYEAIAIDHSQTDRVDDLLRTAADVLLLDLNLPDDLSIEITRAISDKQLPCKVVLLVPDDHEQLVECIAEGAHGCVLERSSITDLHQAIKKVLDGELFCSADIVATMFSEIARFARRPSWQPPPPIDGVRLTAREQEVLDLLAERKSNKEIAHELCVSLFTVKNHVHNILEKLNVESRVEAVDVARQQNWLSRTF